MLLLLFASLWGAMFALLLCAPYGYYPLFLAITGASIIMYLFSRKLSKLKNKYIYVYSLIPFFVAYTICAFLIFKPADFHYSDTAKTDKDKKAVIFYCEGEMEKYTPYFADSFFKHEPIIFKPFYAMRIKEIYREIGVNEKNRELVAIANEVKNSLLNYKPYYFYICLQNYFPDIKDSIHSAIMDGCCEITILNYSSNMDLEKSISKEIDLETLRSRGITIKFTQAVYSSDIFSQYAVLKIVNMPLGWDGIIIVDSETSTSLKIKNSLLDLGYRDYQVIIDTDIAESIDILKSNGAKNILYFNLCESASGINSDVIVPRIFNSYSSDIKVNGIKSWGYDKRLVKASIDVLMKTEGE